MKTFEEAITGRIVRNEQDFQAGIEAVERYQSLMREIAESNNARQFIIAMVQMPFPEPEASDEDRFFSLMMSAFINGVMVGMEMEKSD